MDYDKTQVFYIINTNNRPVILKLKYIKFFIHFKDTLAIPSVNVFNKRSYIKSSKLFFT